VSRDAELEPVAPGGPNSIHWAVPVAVPAAMRAKRERARRQAAINWFRRKKREEAARTDSNIKRFRHTIKSLPELKRFLDMKCLFR
jgi:hypothetical protein